MSRNLKFTTMIQLHYFKLVLKYLSKLKKKHFSHPFFLVYAPKDSNFSSLLGFHFMQKYNVRINTNSQNESAIEKNIP